MSELTKYNEKRVTIMYEIIAAIDHWLDFWTKGNIDQKVGAGIQRWAMREVAFIDYINDDWVPMDELRSLANDELLRLGEVRVVKPIPWGPSIVDFKVPFPSFGEATGFDFYPFHSFEKKRTRREELEGMTKSEVRQLYYDTRAKERTKERINYILESEKEYK